MVDYHTKTFGTSLISGNELALLVQSLPRHGVLLEIGSYHGVTAAQIADDRQTAHIVCVDPFVHGKAHLRGMLGDEKIWRGNARPNMELHVMTAREFLLDNDRMFDTVFIDGCHEYEYAIDDLRACSPVVKQGGLLVAHDYNRIPGDRVNKAVNEFVKETVWKLVKCVDHTAVLMRRKDVEAIECSKASNRFNLS